MSADLFPCPFCGGEAVMSDWEARGDDEDQFPQDVVCMGCGIGFCGHDAKGKGNAFVAGLWNRRAAAPVPPAQAPVEPVAYLLLDQGCRAPDDCEDYERVEMAIDIGAEELERFIKAGRATPLYAAPVAQPAAPVQAEKEVCSSCDGAGHSFGDGCIDCNAKGFNWEPVEPSAPVDDLTDAQINEIHHASLVSHEAGDPPFRISYARAILAAARSQA